MKTFPIEKMFVLHLYVTIVPTLNGEKCMENGGRERENVKNAFLYKIISLFVNFCLLLIS